MTEEINSLTGTLNCRPLVEYLKNIKDFATIFSHFITGKYLNPKWPNETVAHFQEHYLVLTYTFVSGLMTYTSIKYSSNLLQCLFVERKIYCINHFVIITIIKTKYAIYTSYYWTDCNILFLLLYRIYVEDTMWNSYKFNLNFLETLSVTKNTESIYYIHIHCSQLVLLKERQQVLLYL